MAIKDRNAPFENNLNRTSDILQPKQKKSGVEAYYSRNKENDTQEFIPPIIRLPELTDFEEDMYHDGIHPIDWEVAISNLS